MSDVAPYWKNLISIARRYFQEQGNANAVEVIKKSTIALEFNAHDNWNGGIDYWDVVLLLKYKDFIVIRDKKDVVEGDILQIIEQFHTDERDRIANVIIRPIVEQYIDWKAILPATKESTIWLIQGEQKILTDIATGKASFKEDGVENMYQQQHRQIVTIAARAGFDYPVTANSLVEWWAEVREMPSYTERREYISRLFSSVLNALLESDDNGSDVSFRHIATRSGTVCKAIEDAEVFIREEKYDSAVDRVHTAIHGYLRQLLNVHSVTYREGDGIPALYAKLHTYYEDSIQPADVGDRVKTILRSASGMINAVNELRNNNTIVHPNGQLIQKREAQLVIRLVNAVVDYIEDVEASIA